jgi:hypothetical protein
MHHARQAAWRVTRACAWKLCILSLTVAALLGSAAPGVAAEGGGDDGSSAGEAARAPSPAMALLKHMDLGAWRRRGNLTAAAAAAGGGGSGTANITTIALIGERHHGTNYILATLAKNVEVVGNVRDVFCRFKVGSFCIMPCRHHPPPKPLS